MNNFKILLKNISKKRGIYFLIAIQVMASVWLLLTRVDAIEKINRVDKDIESVISKDLNKVIQLTIIDDETIPENFLKFREEAVEEGYLKYISSNLYTGTVIEEFCNNSNYEKMKNEYVGELDYQDGDINVLEIEKGIEKLMDYDIVKGRNLEDDDFTWYKRGNTIPVLGGYGLYEHGLIDLGDRLKYKYYEDEKLEYEVVGILDKNSKWFLMTSADNNTMVHLKDQFIYPTNIDEDYDTLYIPTMHYIGEIAENRDKEEVTSKLEELAEKYNIKGEFKTLKDSVRERRKIVEEEFKYYLIFSILFLVGTTFGIAAIMVLLLNARKHEIGVRISTGASFHDIKRMLSGEILFVNIISTLVVSIIYFIQDKILLFHYNEVVDILDINLLTFLYVVLAVFFMCLVPIFIITKRLSKLNPADLVGGRE